MFLANKERLARLLIPVGLMFVVALACESPPIPEATATSAQVATQAPTATPNPTATPTITLTPTPGIGSTQVRDADGMVMVYVPEGEFTMGGVNKFTNSLPEHTVYLDSYWIDLTEVTTAMYALCVADGACIPPTKTKSKTHDDYYGNPDFDNYPVVYVNWAQANVYCAWAGAALPSEAQWEKAARGTDGRRFPWGNGSPNSSLLNFNSNAGDMTEVGSFPEGASPYGALDMAGNVWELVADWYDAGYYANSPSSNPTGPETGEARVWRGGDWSATEDWLLSSLRFPDAYPEESWLYGGFRCSLSAAN